MVGERLSQYQIIEELGRGGMGVVYKAEDTKLKRTVALKLLPKHLAGDESAKKRFAQEAIAASRLEHQNICAIHHVDETGDGELYIVMPFYEGMSLRERIDEGEIPIYEIVAPIGIKTISNFVNHIADTEIDPQFR